MIKKFEFKENLYFFNLIARIVNLSENDRQILQFVLELSDGNLLSELMISAESAEILENLFLITNQCIKA